MSSKRANITYTVISLVMMAALVIYLASYTRRMLSRPTDTVFAVRYSTEESFVANGYIVREEEVLTSAFELVEPLSGAGTKVARGEAVARAYTDDKAYETVQKIDELEQKLAQIEKTISTRTSSSDAASLDGQIYDQTIALSKTSNFDELYDLNAQAEELKNLMLRKEYLYGSATGLEDTRDSLKQEIKELKDSSGSTYATLTVERPGTFSSVVDGYEEHLNPAVLMAMSVEEFEQLDSLEVSVPGGAFGKLIDGVDWYFAAVVDTSNVEMLGIGDRVNVLFSGSFDKEVKMDVIRLENTEDGKCLMVLGCNKMLYAVAELRYQAVEISFGEFSGIRVPKEAVTISQEGVMGVFCVSGMTARFREIEIIGQTGEYYIIEENNEDPSSVRIGSEVIVTLKDIYDGKVLQ